MAPEMSMDAMIASRVFERDVVYQHSLRYAERGWAYRDGYDERTRRIPAYSTDIAAAWQIVEHLRVAGWNWDIAGIGGRDDPEPWKVTLYRWGGEGIDAEYEADTATTPLGICRCALAAMDADEGKGATDEAR